MGIDSIGDVVANKILNFFESDPIGIDALLEVLEVQDFQLGDLDHLDGFKIVITGSFDEYIYSSNDPVMTILNPSR